MAVLQNDSMIKQNAVRLKAICDVMGRNKVDERIINEPLLLTEKEELAAREIESKNFMSMLRTSPKEFNNQLRIYFRKISGTPLSALPLDFQDILKTEGLVSHKNEVYAKAGAIVSSHISSMLASTSSEQIGHKITPSYQKYGMLKGIASFGKKSIYDPNTKKTKAEDRAEVIDIRGFQEDKTYRASVIEERKRLIRLGAMASVEQEKYIQMTGKLVEARKKELFSQEKFEANLTPAQLALVTITKGLGKGLLGGSKMLAGGMIAGATGLRGLLSKNKISLETETENIPSVMRSGRREPDEYMPSVMRSGRHRPEPDTDETPSYIMGHTSPTESNAAGKEEGIEVTEKLTEKQIELVEKEVGLLEKIEQNQRKEAEDKDSGGGIGGILKTALSTLLGPVGGLITKLGPLLGTLATAGAALAVGIAAFKVGGIAMKAMGQTDEHGDVIRDSMTDKVAGVFVPKTEEDEDKNAPGYAETSAGKEDAKRHVMFLAGQARLGNQKTTIETVKKEKAPELEAKKVAAVNAIEEKTAAKNAQAVSSIVNSPNTNIVAPVQPKTISGGNDNPRNPDNSLSLYLKSRVTKFS